MSIITEVKLRNQITVVTSNCNLNLYYTLPIGLQCFLSFFYLSKKQRERWREEMHLLVKYMRVTQGIDDTRVMDPVSE